MNNVKSSGVSKRKVDGQQKLIDNARKWIKNTPEICAGILPFKSFDQEGDHGIPGRVRAINKVDIQNITTSLPKYEAECRTDVSLVDICHLHQYLSSDEFNKSLLHDKKYDYVVDAIISYVLGWPTDKINEFASRFPKYDALCTAIVSFREQYVFLYNDVPVVKTSIKMIKAHFAPIAPARKPFDWMSLLDDAFVQHLYAVQEWVSNGDITCDKAELLQRDMPIPYRLPNIDVSTLKNYSRPDVMKFITGEACCCKTTIVTALSDLGWKKYSRGDIGGFNKKPENRAAVGNLHAALNYVLTKPDVIGDRGFIDNVIWTFIMPGCDPKKQKTFIRDLFLFLNSNFNEPAIAEYIRHKAVVFIDPKSTRNKVRQLTRCEDGDSFRGRLMHYTDSQFLAYYVVARLFGWKIICVPYTSDGEIDDEAYKKNVKTIVDFFGKPPLTGEPRVIYDKPSNEYVFDNEFPASVGIYK